MSLRKQVEEITFELKSGLMRVRFNDGDFFALVFDLDLIDAAMREVKKYEDSCRKHHIHDSIGRSRITAEFLENLRKTQT